MKEKEMAIIGQWIADVVHHIENEKKIEEIRNDVAALCERFPLYGDLIADQESFSRKF